jgi:hypothetical protein
VDEQRELSRFKQLMAVCYPRLVALEEELRRRRWPAGLNLGEPRAALHYVRDRCGPQPNADRPPSGAGDAEDGVAAHESNEDLLRECAELAAEEEAREIHYGRGDEPVRYAQLGQHHVDPGGPSEGMGSGGAASPLPAPHVPKPPSAGGPRPHFLYPRPATMPAPKLPPVPKAVSPAPQPGQLGAYLQHPDYSHHQLAHWLSSGHFPMHQATSADKQALHEHLTGLPDIQMKQLAGQVFGGLKQAPSGAPHVEPANSAVRRAFGARRQLSGQSHPLAQTVQEQQQTPSVAAHFDKHAPVRPGDTSLIPILYDDQVPPNPNPGGARLAGVVHYLANRSKEALGGRPMPINTDKGRAEAEPHLVNLMTQEAKRSLGQHASAVGWYKDSLHKARRIFALWHPEIETDPAARMAFHAALAITSNGIAVGENVKHANYAYDYFKKHGRMPTGENVGWGPRKQNMRAAFRTFNDLREQLGDQGTEDFLHSKFTVGELNARGYKISGENSDQVVYGSAVLGPKIGNGFYQNLRGQFDSLTMDMWWMRMIGRLTGNLMNDSHVGVAGALRSFRRELTAAGMPVQPKVFEDDKAALELAKAMKGEFASEGFSQEMNTPANRAAKRLVERLHNPEDDPGSGGKRAWMRKVAHQVLDNLHKAGHTGMQIADLQALLWYPEKDLYGKLGYRDPKAVRMDYRQAAADLARELGFDDKRIAAALSSQKRG